MTSPVRLRRDRRGVAAMEFAFILPILLTMFLVGTELVSYIVARMRISQLALHVADNAARLGEGTVLTARQIREMDINDLLIGASMQAGGLDIDGRGRIVLSDLEPVASPNTTNKYKIVWQRCRGAKTGYTPQYGKEKDTNMNGMGPADQQVRALDHNATMFVEVYYEYQPLLGASFAPSMQIKEIASMAVRERRDLTKVYNTENVAVSKCT